MMMMMMMVMMMIRLAEDTPWGPYVLHLEAQSRDNHIVVDETREKVENSTDSSGIHTSRPLSKRTFFPVS